MTHGQVPNNTQETQQATSYKNHPAESSWLSHMPLGDCVPLLQNVGGGEWWQTVTPLPPKCLAQSLVSWRCSKYLLNEWINMVREVGEDPKVSSVWELTEDLTSDTIPTSIWEWITVDFKNPLMLYKETPQYFQYFYGTFCRYLFQVWILQENLPKVPERFYSACSLCIQTGGGKGVGVVSINNKMRMPLS